MMMAMAGMPSEIKIEDEAMLTRIIHGSIMLPEENNPAFDPAGRLADMDKENVVAAVLIGNPEFGSRAGTGGRRRSGRMVPAWSMTGWPTRTRTIWTGSRPVSTFPTSTPLPA